MEVGRRHFVWAFSLHFFLLRISWLLPEHSTSFCWMLLMRLIYYPYPLLGCCCLEESAQVKLTLDRFALQNFSSLSTLMLCIVVWKSCTRYGIWVIPSSHLLQEEKDNPFYNLIWSDLIGHSFWRKKKKMWERKERMQTQISEDSDKLQMETIIKEERLIWGGLTERVFLFTYIFKDEITRLTS